MSKETALLCNTFSEGKSIWIEFKEGYKLTNRIPHRVPIIVKPPAFMEYMVSGFDWIRSTWAIEVFFREETKTILSCWSVIGDSSGGSCT